MPSLGSSNVKGELLLNSPVPFVGVLSVAFFPSFKQSGFKGIDHLSAFGVLEGAFMDGLRGNRSSRVFLFRHRTRPRS